MLRCPWKRATFIYFFSMFCLDKNELQPLHVPATITSICLKCSSLFSPLHLKIAYSSKAGKTLLVRLFHKEREKKILAGNIEISTLLCWVTRGSFAQFTRRCRSFCSSGLNVASAVDSQTHKGSYIYRINDTLHPPQNSCLLHLADWECRPAPTRRAPLGQLYVCFASPMPEINNDTPMQKQIVVRGILAAATTAWRKTSGLSFIFVVRQPSYPHTCRFLGG